MDETELNRRLKKIEEDIAKILKLLLGNGDAGIITELALQKQKVEDLPKPAQLKFFAMIGGAAVSGIGIISWLIYQALRSAFSGT
jgi:hypothetical protein